jgi:hypothetical protein
MYQRTKNICLKIELETLVTNGHSKTYGDDGDNDDRNSVQFFIYLRAYSTERRPSIKKARVNERNKTNIYTQTTKQDNLYHL